MFVEIRFGHNVLEDKRYTLTMSVRRIDGGTNPPVATFELSKLSVGESSISFNMKKKGFLMRDFEFILTKQEVRTRIGKLIFRLIKQMEKS